MGKYSPDFFEAVKQKAANKVDKLRKLVAGTGCYAFQISIPHGDRNYAQYKHLNGQLYVVPNQALLDALLQETKNKVGLGLVSLKDCGHMPWDEGQPYLPRWQSEPWSRNWHLWFMLDKTIFNNALARIVTFKYPEHMHADSWSQRKFNKEYDWMNLVLEPIFFLPKNYRNVLLDVLTAILNGSFEKIADLPDYATDPNVWNELLAFAREDKRAETHHHLVVHDKIQKPSEIQDEVVQRGARTLPSHGFAVSQTIEDAHSLAKSNCLNLGFILGEAKFIDAVRETFGEQHAETIKSIAELFGLNRLDYTKYQDKYGAAYTSAQLLQQTISRSPVVFLNGALPTQRAQSRGQLKLYQLPLREMGVDEELADVINNPDYREIVSTDGSRKRVMAIGDDRATKRFKHDDLDKFPENVSECTANSNPLGI